MKRVWLGAAAAAALAFAGVAYAADGPSADLTQAPRMGGWGFDMSGRDGSVKPGDDYFRYANGVWVDQLDIPADRSRYGAFDKLTALSEARVQAVLDKASENATATGDEAQIGAFYRSFMNESRVESLGAKPLKGDLEAVRKAKSREAIATLQGATTSGFGAAFFDVAIDADAKAPDRYAVYLVQGGLGMPDRDYYLEAKFADKKAAYEAYVAKLLKMVGWSKPAEAAKAIVAMETQIAQVSWTRAEQHDPDKTYNPATIAELEALAPGYPWKAYLAGAQISHVQRVIVSENTAFPKIAAIYAATPVETLQAWQAFTVADQAAPYLSTNFDQASFEFRNKTLSGQPQQRPRWKRGVAAINRNLGEAVGRVYVDRYFPPESKAKMDALVGDLKTAMRGRIERLDWMSAATKERALDKLAKFNVKIGYPSKWRDYSAMVVTDADLYGNVERGSAFEWKRRVDRLDLPVDKEEWGMTPQTVNAYYDATNNEIVFPAAILQPPFFDPEADMAINYGAIGGVIGHEITHGFDDDGRKFDGDGKLANWWTDEDIAKFTAQTDRLGAQYSAMEPLAGSHINGELTMGENIADLGGLLLGLDAYKASLKGQPDPIVDGLTGTQRVFLGWAQVWRAKSREDALRQMLVSDPHSPPSARVNGPVRNIDAWYEAFGVKEGDKLYVKPEDRVHIW